MMFNWIARNSKETESEQVTTILSVAYVIYAIQLNSQYHHSIEYKFSEPNFFWMLYVFVRPGVSSYRHFVDYRDCDTVNISA